MHGRLCLAAIGLALACVACGGGGSAAGSAPPLVVPSVAPLTVTGRVVDTDNGNTGIGGVTVIIGNAIVNGETPPPIVPAGTVRTVTAVDGSFRATGIPLGNVATDFATGAVSHTGSMTLLEAFADGYVAYHAQQTVGTAANVATIAMTKATADDLAWLAAVNADRAGAGASPVALDSLLLQAARAWATHEVAAGLFGFTDPALPANSTDASLQNEYTTRGGFTVAGAGNFTLSAADAEGAFRTEAPANGPHWRNIVDPSFRWIGLSSALCVSDVIHCRLPNSRTWVQFLSIAPS